MGSPKQWLIDWHFVEQDFIQPIFHQTFGIAHHFVGAVFCETNIFDTHRGTENDTEMWANGRQNWVSKGTMDIICNL